MHYYYLSFIQQSNYEYFWEFADNHTLGGERKWKVKGLGKEKEIIKNQK